jgi:hypothetical protein
MIAVAIMNVIIAMPKKFVSLAGLEWTQTARNIAYHKITNKGITTAQKQGIKYVWITGMGQLVWITVRHIVKNILMDITLVIGQMV